MPGHLFASYFLTEGIRDTPEWKASLADPERFAAFRDGVRQCYETLSGSADPNEAATEQELIRPVLELLGWDDYLPQQGAARNEDIPDHLLFPDAGSKARAAARPRPEERFRDAIVVEESKRFGLPLDARDADGRGRSRTPHGQILRYLSTAEVESESRIRWGILTNGGVWRLYDYRARPRASGYFETDLGEALQARQRGRPAPLPPAAAPELVHAAAGRHGQLPGDGAGGGPAPRAAGRRRHFRHGRVRARLPRPRPGAGRPPRTTICRRCARPR